MHMLVLLVTVVEFSDSQTHNSAFPRVDPSRQQFFRLETITISCEGLHGFNGWRVMKKINGDIRTCISTWESSTGPCEITNAYPSSDSGEYWCEMGGLQRSNSVNITVTDGSVILESPVAPVKEGDNVIVYCRKKQTESSFTAEFYKNGVSIGSSSAGTIIMPSVSKSFEGLYKCSISEKEESPGSWLIVNESTIQFTQAGQMGSGDGQKMGERYVGKLATGWDSSPRRPHHKAAYVLTASPLGHPGTPGSVFCF
ncbi:Fc receptor-like protein 5 [Archocentrus centrarchus]|uniref:Fc receptor-like protein 5 n=1 Tax=Archocentrus centrarchus TaxID=63155 RepID=UPI0011E9ECF8|nr:Fc receptor-like protein 5 [Archocentrus centrarchus]